MAMPAQEAQKDRREILEGAISYSPEELRGFRQAEAALTYHAKARHSHQSSKQRQIATSVIDQFTS
jgi:hypothetical protein